MMHPYAVWLYGNMRCEKLLRTPPHRITYVGPLRMEANQCLSAKPDSSSRSLYVIARTHSRYLDLARSQNIWIVHINSRDIRIAS